MSAAQIDFTAVRGYTELGDEVLAALVDTTAETLGVDETTELVTNGTFDTDTSGWSSSNATLSVVSGAMRVTIDSNGTAYAFQALTTVIGQTYIVSATVVTDSATGNHFIDVGTSQGGINVYRVNFGTATTQTFIFKADSTTTYISLKSDGSGLAAEFLEWDNVSVKKTGNLVENHNFLDTTNSQWSKGTGWSIGSGVASCDGSQTGLSYLVQSSVFIAADVGKQFVCTFTISNYSAGTVALDFTGSNGTARSANGTYTETLTVATAGDIGIKANSTFVGDIDNVSVILAEPDVSTNADGLEIHGQITKAAVDTGADLMSYSGYSDDNYLQQPYNSNLDPATNDIFAKFHIKNSGNSGTETIFERDSASTAQRISAYLDSSGNLVFEIDDNTTVRSVTSTAVLDDDSWRSVILYYDQSAGAVYIYIDGSLDNSATGSVLNTLTNTSAVLTIGNSTGLSTPFTNGEIALFRLYVNDAPTSAEINTLYNNEKHLFDRYAYYTKEGNQYTLSNVFSEKDRDNNVIKSKNISIGGVVESLVDRFEIFHNVTSGLLHYATDLPQWREFLYCVQGDETFTYTPGGGYEPNTAVTCSLESKSHSERRVSSSIYHRISLKLRDRSDG